MKFLVHKAGKYLMYLEMLSISQGIRSNAVSLNHGHRNHPSIVLSERPDGGPLFSVMAKQETME